MVCHFVIKISLLSAMVRGDGGGHLIARQESTFVTIKVMGSKKRHLKRRSARILVSMLQIFFLLQAMLAQKQAEEAIVLNLAIERENESKEEEKHEDRSVFSVKDIPFSVSKIYSGMVALHGMPVQLCFKPNVCVSYTQIHSYAHTFVNTHFIPSTPFGC
ncbi:uncharacterized protein LOC130751185 [Actinidia eriantha]|uniref:uncharacterized protein LOC130751185 n=1 Tax=Actinidia eriantha TaxID=165200 RepID=UPI0025908217|nr:uncharacterized protein LOC130751185 [Actinidia eriantha]